MAAGEDVDGQPVLAAGRAVDGAQFLVGVDGGVDGEAVVGQPGLDEHGAGGDQAEELLCDPEVRRQVADEMADIAAAIAER